jgi:hypothetical protein
VLLDDGPGGVGTAVTIDFPFPLPQEPVAMHTPLSSEAEKVLIIAGTINPNVKVD